VLQKYDHSLTMSVLTAVHGASDTNPSAQNVDALIKASAPNCKHSKKIEAQNDGHNLVNFCNSDLRSLVVRVASLAGVAPPPSTANAVAQKPAQNNAQNVQGSGQNYILNVQILDVVYPWLASKNYKNELIALDHKSQEYQQVSTQFAKSLPNKTIVKISEYRDNRFWFFYYNYRYDLEQAQNAPVQMDLWHGTDADVISTILLENFDFRLAGSRVGALWGSGSYFALDAKTSLSYCSAGKSGQPTLKMLLVNVVVGNYCLGAKGMKRPPVIPNTNQLYDSVVDDVKKPTMFVTFDRYAQYPRFVVEFK